MSPRDSRTWPSGSTSTAAPRWRDSSRPSRSTTASSTDPDGVEGVGHVRSSGWVLADPARVPGRRRPARPGRRSGYDRCHTVRGSDLSQRPGACSLSVRSGRAAGGGTAGGASPPRHVTIATGTDAGRRGQDAGSGAARRRFVGDAAGPRRRPCRSGGATRSLGTLRSAGRSPMNLHAVTGQANVMTLGDRAAAGAARLPRGPDLRRSRRSCTTPPRCSGTWCARQGVPRDDAEDVVQGVWVAFVRHTGIDPRAGGRAGLVAGQRQARRVARREAAARRRGAPPSPPGRRGRGP